MHIRGLVGVVGEPAAQIWRFVLDWWQVLALLGCLFEGAMFVLRRLSWDGKDGSWMKVRIILSFQGALILLFTWWHHHLRVSTRNLSLSFNFSDSRGTFINRIAGNKKDWLNALRTLRANFFCFGLEAVGGSSCRSHSDCLLNLCIGSSCH